MATTTRSRDSRHVFLLSFIPIFPYHQLYALSTFRYNISSDGLNLLFTFSKMPDIGLEDIERLIEKDRKKREADSRAHNRSQKDAERQEAVRKEEECRRREMQARLTSSNRPICPTVTSSTHTTGSAVSHSFSTMSRPVVLESSSSPGTSDSASELSEVEYELDHLTGAQVLVNHKRKLFF
jgi:hypothetical protein